MYKQLSKYALYGKLLVHFRALMSNTFCMQYHTGCIIVQCNTIIIPEQYQEIVQYWYQTLSSEIN